MRNCLLLLACLTLLISCGTESGKKRINTDHRNQVQESNLLLVTKVVDGDTFWANDEVGSRIKVRLIGVDAPESRKTFKREVGYYGREAKNYLNNLLLNKRVRLEFDVGRYDKYQRVLAYVYDESGLFINAELVKNGYAVVMTVPPNVKYADYFLNLQQEARKHSRGLWNQ